MTPKVGDIAKRKDGRCGTVIAVHLFHPKWQHPKDHVVVAWFDSEKPTAHTMRGLARFGR